jgi:hypothetical protein
MVDSYQLTFHSLSANTKKRRERREKIEENISLMTNMNEELGVGLLNRPQGFKEFCRHTSYVMFKPLYVSTYNYLVANVLNTSSFHRSIVLMTT